MFYAKKHLYDIAVTKTNIIDNSHSFIPLSETSFSKMVLRMQ